MAGTWKEVAQLRFVGERFRDHALDLTALTELRQFQRLVAETAKALWRAANPERERLPAHFEARTRLCLRRIDEGSAVAPLEVYLEEPGQGEFWSAEPQEVTQAIDLAHRVFDCLAHDQPLPDPFPRELVPEYQEWGKSLGPNEQVELAVAWTPLPVRVDGKSRERLEGYREAPHADTVELTGRVLEADVRQRRFQLWIDESTPVQASFDEAQEDVVTSALKDHRAIRVRVRGRASVSPQGKPLRFTEVEALTVLRDEEPALDTGAPPIEEVLARIGAQVPPEEWRKLPPDLTDQLDHYLYGTPRRR